MLSQNRKILWGSDRNALVYLLAINAIIFIMLRMLFVIFQNNPETINSEYGNLLSQFVLPNSFGDIIYKPWTLVTSFFTHVSFGMFFSNMLWLFSFSWLLQTVAGNKYVFPAYFYGGLTGSLVFLTMNALFPAKPSEAILVGAAAAIYSVSATAVTLAPGFRIFPFIRNGIPVWVLLAAFTVIDILGLAFAHPMMIPVHLSGLLAGYFYAVMLQRGSDPGAWMGRLYDYISGRKIKKDKGPDKKFYTDGTTPFEKKMKVSQSTVDEILDKINEHGYQSLSKEEKEVLKKARHEL
jgi:membrane associated rhomboid family serine protease